MFKKWQNPCGVSLSRPGSPGPARRHSGARVGVPSLYPLRAQGTVLSLSTAPRPEHMCSLQPSPRCCSPILRGTGTVFSTLGGLGTCAVFSWHAAPWGRKNVFFPKVISGSHSYQPSPGLRPITVPAYLALAFPLLTGFSSLSPSKLWFYISPELIPSTWQTPETRPEYVSLSFFLLNKQGFTYIFIL